MSIVEWFARIWTQVPEWNTALALLLYWTPMLICFVGYTIRSLNQIRGDVEKRNKYLDAPNGTYYQPSISVGHLIGRFVVSIIPAINLLAAIFSVGIDILKEIGSFFEALFDIPLVPKPPQSKTEQILREEAIAANSTRGNRW